MAGTTGLEPAASAVTVRFRVYRPCVFNILDNVQTPKKRPFGACCPRVAPEFWPLPFLADFRLSFANRLVFIQIFAGHVILRHLMRANFLLIRAAGGFHARDYVGFKRVSFLQQIADTLRICTLDAGQSLQDRVAASANFWLGRWTSALLMAR